MPYQTRVDAERRRSWNQKRNYDEGDLEEVEEAPEHENKQHRENNET